jgi:hypothetical protein
MAAHDHSLAMFGGPAIASESLDWLRMINMKDFHETYEGT